MSAVVFARHAMTPVERLRDAAWVELAARIEALWLRYHAADRERGLARDALALLQGLEKGRGPTVHVLALDHVHLAHDVLGGRSKRTRAGGSTGARTEGRHPAQHYGQRRGGRQSDRLAGGAADAQYRYQLR